MTTQYTVYGNYLIVSYYLGLAKTLAELELSKLSLIKMFLGSGRDLVQLLGPEQQLSHLERDRDCASRVTQTVLEIFQVTKLTPLKGRVLRVSTLAHCPNIPGHGPVSI